MRKFVLFNLLTVAMLLFCSTNSIAQTTLNKGDIAIIGLNGDAPDSFSFITFVDLQAGTVIYFTDSGVKADGTFRNSEGAIKYTAANTVKAGTVITCSDITNLTGEFSDGNSAEVGTNGANFSASGDQLIAFQGTAAAPQFIFAMQSNSNEWQAEATSSTTSALPTGLTNGTNAVACGAGPGDGDEYDNVAYDWNNKLTSGTKAELLAAIANKDNWVGDNSNRYDFSTANFTLNTGGADTNAPVASFSPADSEENVAINANIKITFDEAIKNADASEVTDANVASIISMKETDNSGADVAFTATIDAEKKIITIDPTNDLKGGQVYFVSVASIEDAATNESAVQSINFTTIATDKKQITAFTVKGKKATIDEDAKTISTELYYGTDLTALVAEFEFLGKEVKVGDAVQTSGTTANDFTSTVTYTVVAYDNTTVNYKVTISTEQPTELTIVEIQTPGDDGDVSKHKGTLAKTTGVVTRVRYNDKSEQQGYYIGTAGNEFAGVYVYDKTNKVTAGDKIEVIGTVSEFSTTTQLGYVKSVKELATGESITPVEVKSNEVAAEKYEGMLIIVKNGKVISTSDKGFVLNTGDGDVSVDNYYFKFANPVVNKNYDVTGIVDSYKGNFNIKVFSNDDIVENTGTGIDTFVKENSRVYPNPAKENVFVDFPTEANEYTVIVLDMLGKAVSQEITTEKVRKGINIASLKSGIYFIQFTDGTNTVVKRLIVK